MHYISCVKSAFVQNPSFALNSVCLGFCLSSLRRMRPVDVTVTDEGLSQATASAIVLPASALVLLFVSCFCPCIYHGGCKSSPVQLRNSLSFPISVEPQLPVARHRLKAWPFVFGGKEGCRSF